MTLPADHPYKSHVPALKAGTSGLFDRNWWRNRLYTPTYVQKLGAHYFCVDCWHHCLRATDDVMKPIQQWRVVDAGLSGPHSIATDGAILVVDDTDHGAVRTYHASTLEHIQTISLGPASDRPHRVVYDVATAAFYVIKSEVRRIVKLMRSGSTLTIEHESGVLPGVGGYTRSIRIYDGKLYCASEPGRIHELAFDGSVAGYAHLATYNLPAGMGSPNDMFRASDGSWYVSATRNAAIAGVSLAAIHGGAHTDIRSAWGMIGTPYSFAEFDGAIWAPVIYDRNGIYRREGGATFAIHSFGAPNASSATRYQNPP